MGELLLAVLAGFVAAALTTPAGVSGAVFLLPVQMGLLGVAPAVAAPTNLIFNLVAAPVGAARLRRLAPPPGDLLGAMLLGALPGMVAGAALRATGAVGEGALRVLVAAVLVVVAVGLLLPVREGRGAPRGRVVVVLAATAGVVGGLYGIGGGAVLVPALAACGASVAAVRAPALVVTLATSVLGLAVFQAAAWDGDGPGADWSLGLALGSGGAIGALVGARLAPHVPARALRWGLAVIALLLAARIATTP